MSKLQKLMQKVYNDIRLNESPFFGSRYVPSGEDEEDREVDFPYVYDNKPYVTNVPLENKTLKEQDEDIPSPEEAGIDAAEQITTTDTTPTSTTDTNNLGTPGEGTQSPTDFGAGGIAGIGGLGEQEEPLTRNQLGRVYELKKIYSRLSSVESFLSRTTDDNMLEVRKLVSQSIDLFELVISNFDQYKENVDEIIVTYYQLLDSVYTSLKEYFKTTKE